MAIYRLARREPLRRVTAALQPLTRGVAIACGLRLAVTRLRGSENVNLYETVHWYGLIRITRIPDGQV